MAISAAATVKTNIANTWPTISPRYTENATKFKFTPSKINSNDIRIAIILFLLMNIPKTPSVKRIEANIR